MQILKKLLFLLTPRERKYSFFLLIMIIIMALLDMIGVASILPFMAVLSSPELINTNIILNTSFKASSIFGVKNEQHFIFVLGVLVFILLILSLAFKALTTYALVRFSQMREHSIGKRLVEGYLHQPYSWFLNRHSTDLGKTILSEVQQVVGAGLTPMFDLIARGMVSIALIVLLIIVDPKLTLIVGIFLGGSYALIYFIIRKYLNRIGDARLKNNELRFKIVTEVFSAVKEVKLGGLEKTYIKGFDGPSKIFARSHAYSRVIGQLPKFLLEAIAFGGILLIILYIMAQTGGFNNALPIISLYVFAGYRLLPALQQIYVAVTQLIFIRPALDKLNDDFKIIKKYDDNQDQGKLLINKDITLKNINYNYPNSSKTAIKNISLKIPAKFTIGIIGSTGCGKTTTADIILGLLEPQKGTLEIDGQIITKKNLSSWQKSIGYVPQSIYLSDNTVAANIAFGVNPENIDNLAIEKAAKIANLHNFVFNDLPKQYQTTIGERGVRLSGGQRQRIGIARALYHNPQLLVLDEATSALDSQTEQAVMEAVNNLGKDITIILIAHRLSTVKNCDIIFKLDKGQLVSQGTFDEVISNN